MRAEAGHAETRRCGEGHGQRAGARKGSTNSVQERGGLEVRGRECGVGRCRDHPTQRAPRTAAARGRGGCLNEKRLLCEG